MAHIVLRPRARLDILELSNYVAGNSDERTADALIGKVERKLRLLAERPAIGRRRDELRPGLRSAPVSRYVVFYLPIPRLILKGLGRASRVRLLSNGKPAS